jgi:hypothetical protein
MLADLLHLSRNLRRSPASALAAALTLSLSRSAPGPPSSPSSMQ